jgi:putative aldouronate transport system permease protein
MLAFVLSRKKFIFAKPISFLYVLTMYVNGGLIPGFLLNRSLGFMNSFWVYIIPGMVAAFNMLVIRTYMNGLPDSLEESAMIDGAGYFTIFARIIAPLCKPVFATVALFIAVGQWNSWFDTMLFNRLDENLTTLQYELMKLLSSVSQLSGDANVAGQNGVSAAAQVTTTSVRSAATVLTCLPIIALYPFLQRYFVSGLTIGGVKE